MAMGLRVPQGSSFRDMAYQHGAQGLSAFSQQRPDTETKMNPPGKTAGGALMAGAGMGMAGAQAGGMIAGAGAGAAATESALMTSAPIIAGSAGTGVAGGVSTGAAAGTAAGPGYGTAIGAIVGAGVGILAYMLS